MAERSVNDQVSELSRKISKRKIKQTIKTKMCDAVGKESINCLVE